jgi:hypothetical protein
MTITCENITTREIFGYVRVWGNLNWVLMTDSVCLGNIIVEILDYKSLKKDKNDNDKKIYK